MAVKRRQLDNFYSYYERKPPYSHHNRDKNIKKRVRHRLHCTVYTVRPIYNLETVWYERLNGTVVLSLYGGPNILLYIKRYVIRTSYKRLGHV